MGYVNKISHLRLVIDHSNHFLIKKGARNLKPPFLALLEEGVLVAVREPIPCAPIRDGVECHPAHRGYGVRAAQRFDQILNGRNHACSYRPNNLGMSSVQSSGLQTQRPWATIFSMKEQVRDLESLAKRIKALREIRGWTPRQAYEACGIQKNTWSNYETGYSRPTVDHAASICDVFGVSLDWLYAGVTTGLSQSALSSLYGRQA